MVSMLPEKAFRDLQKTFNPSSVYLRGRATNKIKDAPKQYTQKMSTVMVSAALTNAERKRKYIENLKLSGRYEEIKRKKAADEKLKRSRMKENLEKVPKKMKMEMLQLRRNESRQRVKKFREKKQTNGRLLAKNVYTSHALRKAVKKVKRSMPYCPVKRKEIIGKLFFDLAVDEQEEILKSNKQMINASNRGLPVDLIKEVIEFYIRDDVSRQSPNVKDTRYFIDPLTGKTELKAKRHMVITLSEAHNMFIEEYSSRNPDGSGKLPLTLSKFCALRPSHVNIVGNTPKNMCLCIYHSNFIEACAAMHKAIPEFPAYGEVLLGLILCDGQARNCWLRQCKKCTTKKIREKISQSLLSLNKKASVKWFVWKKDGKENRFYKSEENGSLETLIDHFISLCDSFLVHSFTKRRQSASFNNDCKRIKNSSDEALLQIDFAECYCCVAQDEVQVAHWNQRNISLFTSALTWSTGFRPSVTVSDNTDHSKYTIIPYIHTILRTMPQHIKKVTIWSDGPRQQFKNKFMAHSIKIFEKVFGFKLIWNYFATAHGKGCIDGLGAVVKKKVRTMVDSRKIIVNNAKDFVNAFNISKSVINVTEMSSDDMHRINTELNTLELLDNVKGLKNISTFHQIQAVKDNVIGFLISDDGYQM